MFKGPCRGKMCDFWARVKIRKMSEDELVTRLQDLLDNGHHANAENSGEIMREFWESFGVKDLGRLCNEEPELCSKMKRVETLAIS